MLRCCATGQNSMVAASSHSYDPFKSYCRAAGLTGVEAKHQCKPSKYVTTAQAGLSDMHSVHEKHRHNVLQEQPQPYVDPNSQETLDTCNQHAECFVSAFQPTPSEQSPYDNTIQDANQYCFQADQRQLHVQNRSRSTNN